MKINRSCGDCQECCFAYDIGEIEKPPHATCPHQCATGCAIWKSKPVECTAFACLWLMDFFPDHLRPDKSKIIVDQMPMGGFLYPDVIEGTIKCIRVIETEDGAARLPGNAKALKVFIDSPRCAVVLHAPHPGDTPERRWLLLPGGRRVSLTPVHRKDGVCMGWSLPNHRDQYEYWFNNPPAGAKEQIARREALFARFDPAKHDFLGRIWNQCVAQFRDTTSDDQREKIMRDLLAQYEATLSTFSEPRS